MVVRTDVVLVESGVGYRADGTGDEFGIPAVDCPELNERVDKHPDGIDLLGPFSYTFLGSAVLAQTVEFVRDDQLADQWVHLYLVEKEAKELANDRLRVLILDDSFLGQATGDGLPLVVPRMPPKRRR